MRLSSFASYLDARIVAGFELRGERLAAVDERLLRGDKGAAHWMIVKRFLCSHDSPSKLHRDAFSAGATTARGSPPTQLLPTAAPGKCLSIPTSSPHT